jgi:Rod binding domain-containing protein
MDIFSNSPVVLPPVQQIRSQPNLEETAKAFETVFVAQMLETAGFGRARGAFGGGAGEDAFASMAIQHTAEAFVERGGLGLTASIVQALVQRGK